MRTSLIPKALLGAGVALGLGLGAALLGACSSDKTAADTTAVAAESTGAAADTAGAPRDTAAADTPGAATAAADTAATDAETLKVAMITQLLAGLVGGVPEQKDIDCVSGKVSDADTKALVDAASGGDASSLTSGSGMKAFTKAAIGCRPKGLADALVQAFFPAGVDATAAQKECVATKTLDLIANDDSILTAMIGSGDRTPEAVKAKGAAIVKDCLPPGPARDAMLAELAKS